MKKILMVILMILCLFSPFAKGSKEVVSDNGPTKISMLYSDNATLPFKDSWLTIQEAQKRTNTELEIEAIPIADYKTKVSLALNTGKNAPDVILYQSTMGENAALAINGAIVPISDYPQWTPHFNKAVKDLKLEKEVEKLNLKDGKRYYMPGLVDVPFYDGGLILRADLLEKYNLEEPKTYDDLYKVMKVFKEHNPSSYPLTILAGPRVLYRMTMPAWGISLGKNGASGTNTLSWDYKNNKFFPGAISEEYRSYARYLAKLYKEGLLDPEMAEPIAGNVWSAKLVNGSAMVTYAYYDQIGGLEGASTIDGYKLQMYPALEGPAGAHHQPKSKVKTGIIFPAKTAKRADFEKVVRAVDEMFFSPENAKMWALGVKGVTYEEENGKVKFDNKYVNDPRGLYKSLQVETGAGNDVTQLIWINKREMSKYDENYARINAEVEAMGDVIQPIPPVAKFDELTAEEAGSLQTPLADAFERWNSAFISGNKSLDSDWDAYVKEMKDLGIEKFNKLYNDNL